MQIAFWSTMHGRGSTANCIAISLSFALNFDARCLLTNTQYIMSNLDDAFFTKKQQDSFEKYEYGLDSLDRLVVAKPTLSNFDFSNYCNTIIDDRLDLLCGSQKVNADIYKDTLSKTITRILENGKKYYDVTFVDVNSGMNDEITRKTMDMSDIIVVTLDQSEKMISDFFEKYYYMIKNKKILLAIGKYDRNSKCSKKYIFKNFNYNDEIYSVPYNTAFLDAFNNHRVKEFFLSNNRLVREEKDSNFFSEINLIIDRLYEQLNAKNIEKMPLGRINFISKVKNMVNAV